MPGRATFSAMTTPEALMARVPSALLSHESAARLLGIELLEDDGTQRITVPRNHARIAASGWQVARSDVPVAHRLVTVGGLRLTAALRTVIDLCRVLDLTGAVVAADSALRLRFVTAKELTRALQAARGRGSRRLHEVALLVDPQCGSVLESVLRLVLLRSGLRPVTQYHVWEGQRLIARVDFCWPAARLIVEADGFAFHSDRSAYRRDRLRLNDLERLGWTVLRFTWEDVMLRPDHVAGTVRECLTRAA